ncbi:unnamed protein product [Heligmosomoides polygyrus]|uniref:Uncharacterized protein n=1 Tax=Heligmosomoides polygyrus TaxID=6339 RepID=A0A183GAP8_HELPZ|nr:unnamed protein product [Heligmosomoides polygyrus]
MTRNEPVARGFSASTTKLVVLIKKFRGRDDDADDTSGSCGFDLLYGAGRDARTFVFASTVFRRLTLHRIGVAIASQQQHRVLVHHDEESDGDLGGQARFELFLMGTVRSLHPRLPYLHVRAKSTPCLRCENEACKKTLEAGSHSERDGKPYCNGATATCSDQGDMDMVKSCPTPSILDRPQRFKHDIGTTWQIEAKCQSDTSSPTHSPPPSDL